MARKSSRNGARGGSGRSSKPSSATLPYDITCMICVYFCSHCNNEYRLPYGPLLGAEKAQDSGTLYNLCLVSRLWRDVAQQVLYHSFHPDYSPPRKRIPKSPQNPWKLRLEPFLRTIAARPDLAGSIQTVILRDLVIYGLDFYESRRAFDECARALGTSSREIYYKGHHASAPSAIREAFFLGTPVSILPDASTLASEIAGELLSALVAFLPQLKHLAIEEEYLWGGWKYDVSPITLDALGVRSIPVETVEMERPLYHLLSRCTELDRLYTADVICPELFRALHRRSLHDNLEILHLDIRHGRMKLPLRSLRKFTKLRDLLLPTSLVYDDVHPPWFVPTVFYEETITGILPPNLINLFLVTEVDTQRLLKIDLWGISKLKNKLYPKLESIRTNLEVYDRSLPKLLDGVGIELVCQVRATVIHQVLEL